MDDAVNKGYYWPFRGRLNHDEGSHSWGPSSSPGVGNWFQVRRLMFSNSLIIHQVETKEIKTVTVIWMRNRI